MSTLKKVLIFHHPLGAYLGKIPMVADAYRANIWRRHMDVEFGVYGSYAEAKDSIPADLPPSWDCGSLADHMASSLTTDQPSVYPVMFWLKNLLSEGTKLIDLGGCLGQVYHTYRTRSPFPAGASWTVVDVPAIIDKARKVHESIEAPGLHFEEDIARAGACDILVSGGCLQYMEQSIGSILDAMVTRPRHILLNKLPLTNHPSYWTVQRLPHSASPYRIFNETDLLKELATAGYVVRDRWKVPGHSIEIPFRPDRHVPHLDGLYLERASSAA